MLRRLRYQLYERVLRFPLHHFNRTASGATIAMLTGELEPVDGFIGRGLRSADFARRHLANDSCVHVCDFDQRQLRRRFSGQIVAANMRGEIGTDPAERVLISRGGFCRQNVVP